jgi:SAM-dependent methyltransferase
VQRLAFRKILRAHFHRLNLSGEVRILDIGCGTGAHVSVLAEEGHHVWAVDASPRMVAMAMRLLGRQPGSGQYLDRLSVSNPLEGFDFPDRYFDLVHAAHVVHGLLPAERRRFFIEAGRVSRGLVILQDFPPGNLPGPRPLARILEALERSDYRRFRRQGLREMRDLFATVEVIYIGRNLAWYICRLKP